MYYDVNRPTEMSRECRVINDITVNGHEQGTLIPWPTESVTHRRKLVPTSLNGGGVAGWGQFLQVVTW